MPKGASSKKRLSQASEETRVGEYLVEALGKNEQKSHGTCVDVAPQKWEINLRIQWQLSGVASHTCVRRYIVYCTREFLFPRQHERQLVHETQHDLYAKAVRHSGLASRVVNSAQDRPQCSVQFHLSGCLAVHMKSRDILIMRTVSNQPRRCGGTQAATIWQIRQRSISDGISTNSVLKAHALLSASPS